MSEIDSREIISNFSKVIEKYHTVCQRVASKKHKSVMVDPLNVSNTYLNIMAQICSNPQKLAEHQIFYTNSQMQLLNNVTAKFMGENCKPAYSSGKKDRRFMDEEWEDSIVFNYLKQSYLMNSEWLRNITKDLDGVDKAQARKIDFYTRQFIDASSPSNFAITNPRVLKEISETGGKNLVEGLDNLLRDIEKSKGVINIKTASDEGFKVGKNIGCTKGKVVYQNDLIQLIHYTPTKKTNYQVPILIAPPWINKFYILDLREENSLVKWLLDQGYPVFLISWVNPSVKLKNKNLEDYMLEGPVAAIESIVNNTSFKKINVMGYCVGGTILSCAMSYFKDKKKDYVNSATLITTLIDFSNSGDLQIFAEDEQLEIIEDHMDEQGYLDGSDMGLCFSMLRANDMIWSFFVNNYLLGKEPFPIDLLYWNSDSARLPAAMHSFYLRNLYKENLLKKPGGLNFGGVDIDLSKVDVPCYFISAIEDHIAPWKATYAGIKIFKGDIRFVLSASGHVAGVVNHPSAKKYCYWTNEKIETTPSKWLKDTKKHEGSWWIDWDKWASKVSGKKVRAVMPEDSKFKMLEDAPGSYVLKKYI